MNKIEQLIEKYGNIRRTLEYGQTDDLCLDILQDLQSLQPTTEERDDDEMKSEMESAIQDWMYTTEEREVEIKSWPEWECECWRNWFPKTWNYCPWCWAKIKRVD